VRIKRRRVQPGGVFFVVSFVVSLGRAAISCRAAALQRNNAALQKMQSGLAVLAVVMPGHAPYFTVKPAVWAL
jgi:hypothetical protein